MALRWAIGDRESLPVGGQVSLMQAVPDVDTDEQVRTLLATTLRPEEDLRRALELWFVVWWRLRLRRHDVAHINLRRWVAESPYLTRLTAADLPLIDDDLSLDGPVMECAADELDVWRDEGWTGRVPIRDCTPEMLTAAENVLRVAEERLRALRWLFGVTPHIDGDPPGAYRADSAAGGDEQVLYGPDAPPPPADPDAHDACGGLALHRAAWRGDLPTLQALLDGGADLTATDIDGDYAIHCAVLGGHRAAIEAVVAAEPFMYHIPNGAGRFPLHLAAGRGDVGAIEALAAGSDNAARGLDATDGVGPPHCSTRSATDTSRRPTAFVVYGASLDGAMTAAVKADQPDMVRYLVKRGVEVDAVEGDVTPLYRALFAGRWDSAAALLDLGADATFAHESGTAAPLHVAADRGATEMCLRLLDRGAEIDRRLGDMTAVHLAFLAGHVDCARALIDRGADSDGPLLALALRGGAAPLIRWCLDRGEAIAEFPGALIECARAGRVDALNVVLAAGADAGKGQDFGVTPLHAAARHGHAACVDALLAAGAPVDLAATDRRFTALHLAAMYGHDDCVAILLAAGASRDERDADGHHALDWALDSGHDGCVALLTG